MRKGFCKRNYPGAACNGTGYSRGKLLHVVTGIRLLRIGMAKLLRVRGYRGKPRLRVSFFHVHSKMSSSCGSDSVPRGTTRMRKGFY